MAAESAVLHAFRRGRGADVAAPLARGAEDSAARLSRTSARFIDECFLVKALSLRYWLE
jgi:hypothetical protein